MSHLSSNRVFVLNGDKTPLMPCTPTRARLLLSSGRAAVFKRFPFTIILKDNIVAELQPMQLGVSLGVKLTGMSISAMFKRGPRCIFAMHLFHRGEQIRLSLLSRRSNRRRRRIKNLRYREPRFSNRCNKSDIPETPSIFHRYITSLTWVDRLSKSATLKGILVNSPEWDKLESNTPNVIGPSKCIYCNGLTGDTRLEKEHIVAVSNGGRNNKRNMAISCRTCNIEKGSLTLKEWSNKLGDDKLSRTIRRNIKKVDKTIDYKSIDVSNLKIIIPKFTSLLKLPVKQVKVSVKEGTKVNLRYKWIDSASFIHGNFIDKDMVIFSAFSAGYGCRRMVTMDKFGFPSGSPKGPSTVHSVRSGDMMTLNKVTGSHIGKYVGSVIIRTTGIFDIKTVDKRIGAKYTNFKMLQRRDGFMYVNGTGIRKIILL